jgi:hypothetical protein
MILDVLPIFYPMALVLVSLLASGIASSWDTKVGSRFEWALAVKNRTLVRPPNRRPARTEPHRVPGLVRGAGQ